MIWAVLVAAFAAGVGVGGLAMLAYIACGVDIPADWPK